MKELPQVKASFFFSGNEFDIDNITTKMNINPTETREKKDFPIKEIAHTLWSLDTKKESCKAIFLQVQKLIEVLRGKETLIKKICKQYNIDAGILISIWMENGDKPEMILTKDSISFFDSINVEVGFDIYVD